MATSINWPPSLPSSALANGYSETHGVLVASTAMDAGPAKRRRRGNKPVTVSVNYQLTPDQLNTLETFVKTTLAGVKRFNWTHPRTRSVVEVRLVPGQDGEFYTLGYLSPTLWSVSLSFEVLP